MFLAPNFPVNMHLFCVFVALCYEASELIPHVGCSLAEDSHCVQQTIIIIYYVVQVEL